MYGKITLMNYAEKEYIEMKKIFKTASAVLLAMSMTVPVFAAPSGDTTVQFSDINTENFAWAKPYINSMAEKGLISGYEDGTFRPDNDVTRLEALSLFARAMGSNDSVNADLLEIAHERYDSVIKNYDLTWGTDEIAYLMYKGVLKKTDLDTYLKDNEKNTAMKRYEAAIIITKAMSGEDAALAQLGVVLNYTDARDVPSNAIQYVSYATEQGIMEGMGDNTFSPNTAVKRSQIAVMLSRTVDKTNYSFKQQKISSVDTDAKTITTQDTAGKEYTYTYTDNTVIKNMGSDITASSLIVGVNATLTLAGDTLITVDTLSSQPDQTITGKYVSYASTSGKTTIKVTSDEDSETKSYECSDSISVTYDGSPATVRSFSKGDTITLELVNGKIERVSGGSKDSTITSATVTNMDITDGVKITISHANKDYDGQTYAVSDDVSVKKNDASVGLDSIYNGDKVNLTLEYGVITKIVATSTKKVVEGTITELTISTQSSMTVSVKGAESTYQIPKDVEILINGEEGSLYDFRVGDAVKLTLDSDAITKIVATSTQESSGHISGVVTNVNTSYGVITLRQDGADTTVQVYAKDDTTKIYDANGATKKMSNIKVGQTLDVRGTVSNGVFVGKMIVIDAE